MWNPRDGIVKLDWESGKSFSDLVEKYWLPPVPFLVAQTLPNKKPPEHIQKIDETIGSVIVTEIDNSELADIYWGVKKYTDESLKEMWEENRKYLKK